MTRPLHTPGPWRVGRGGVVVCDHRITTVHSGHDDVAHYGGHLIAESIWHREDAFLIAAAPAMHDALGQILSATSGGSVTDQEEFENGLHSATVALEDARPPQVRDAENLRRALRELLAIVRTTTGDPAEADRIIANAQRCAAEAP